MWNKNVQKLLQLKQIYAKLSKLSKLNYVLQFHVRFWYLSTTAEDIIVNKNF